MARDELTPALPRGRVIEDRIEIDAPIGAVWRVLAAIDQWHEWNPVYVRASGEMREGAAIRLTILLPGAKPQDSNATVVVVLPDEALRIYGGALGGLVRATRYFQLQPIADGRTLLVSGEVFGGLAGPLLARLIGGRIKAAIVAVGAALKTRSESILR